MQRLYVITIKQGRYSSQVIGATTDKAKISTIISLSSSFISYPFNF